MRQSPGPRGRGFPLRPCDLLPIDRDVRCPGGVEHVAEEARIDPEVVPGQPHRRHGGRVALEPPQSDLVQRMNGVAAGRRCHADHAWYALNCWIKISHSRKFPIKVQRLVRYVIIRRRFVYVGWPRRATYDWRARSGDKDPSPARMSHRSSQRSFLSIILAFLPQIA